MYAIECSWSKVFDQSGNYNFVCIELFRLTAWAWTQESPVVSVTRNYAHERLMRTMPSCAGPPEGIEIVRRAVLVLQGVEVSGDRGANPSSPIGRGVSFSHLCMLSFHCLFRSFPIRKATILRLQFLPGITHTHLVMAFVACGSQGAITMDLCFRKMRPNMLVLAQGKRVGAFCWVSYW